MPDLKNLKHLKKFLFCALVFGLILFSFGSWYNQTKRVFAQEEGTIFLPPEEPRAPGLYCNPEIPIGEAVEDTAKLFVEIKAELEALEAEVPKQILAAENLISFVGQCDVEKCEAHCESYDYPCDSYMCEVPCSEPPPGVVYSKCYDTCWETCTACRTLPCTGHPCPMDAINCELGRVKTAFNNIKTAQETIDCLLENKTRPPYNSQNMSCTACEYILEDPLSENPICQTAVSAIKEKLYKARGDFQQCFTPSGQWKKGLEENYQVKMPLTCREVLKQNIPRKARGENGQCKSLLNFYCCQ